MPKNNKPKQDQDKWGGSPPSAPLNDIPVSHITDWDSVAKVRAALNQFEQGSFSQAAQLVDAMGRDDRITGVLAQRIKSLLGAELTLDPADEDAKSAEVVEFFDYRWNKIVPESAAYELMRWGLMLNAGIGELIWNKTDSEWCPYVKIWHPKFLRWDWTTRTYWISTMDGEVEVIPGDARWLLYTPHGYERGWMGGLVRALAIPFLIRQFTYRDWARYSEVHGMPARVAIVPPQARQETKARFLREIANLSTESVIMTPRDANGVGFDVKFIEATALGWESFEALIEKAESSIAIALLGQNLTTEVKTSGLGSGGGSSVHQQVREDLLKSDAKALSNTIREQALMPATAFNFGDPELAPYPCWNVEPPEDLGQKAKTLYDLSQALAGFGNAGIRINPQAIAEEFGLPLSEEVTEDEQTGELFQYHFDYGVVTKNEVRSRLGLPPVADGDKPIEPPAAPEANPAPSSEELHLLSQKEEAIEGQIYTDAVADSAKLEASQRIDLTKLLAVIDGAADYADLRAKLLNLYRDMNPNELANVMKKAIILADLNGRFSIKG